MKTFRKHTKEEIKDKLDEYKKEKVLEDIICNKCGLSSKTTSPGYECYRSKSLKFSGGYASYYPDDMESIYFDICEHCLKEFVESFKIPAQKNPQNIID